jgi:hypothetical protein
MLTKYLEGREISKGFALLDRHAKVFETLNPSTHDAVGLATNWLRGLNYPTTSLK